MYMPHRAVVTKTAQTAKVYIVYDTSANKAQYNYSTKGVSIYKSGTFKHAWIGEW